MQNEVKQVRPVPESSYGQDTEHLRRVVQAVDGLQNGQGNNHFSVTLDPDVTHTTVIALNATFLTTVQLSPMSQAAATEMADGNVWAVGASGNIVIHHPASSSTDRKYGMLING